MGFTVTHGLESGTNRYVVTVKVALTLAETNSLFLSGDTLLSWPPGELQLAPGPGPERSREDDEMGLRRTGMFISELARLAQGLKIGYCQPGEAERAAELVRMQLARAGIEEG